MLLFHTTTNTTRLINNVCCRSSSQRLRVDLISGLSTCYRNLSSSSTSSSSATTTPILSTKNKKKASSSSSKFQFKATPSSSSFISNANSNTSSNSLPQYKVAKINECGTVSFLTISITELLKKVHARDLFSLALTSIQEYTQSNLKYNLNTNNSNNRSYNSRMSTRYRNKCSAPTAILPRQENILISFGPIRAIICLDGEGYIFDAHKPSVQMFAHSIGDTFQILHQTKELEKQQQQQQQQQQHHRNDSSQQKYNEDNNSGNNDEMEKKQQEQEDYHHGRFPRLTALFSQRNKNMMQSYNNVLPKQQTQESELESTLKRRNKDSDVHQQKNDILDEDDNNDDNYEPHNQEQEQKHEYEKFELIFLEEILRDVCSTYNRRLRLYEPFVDMIATRVSNEMYAASGVHRLVPIKNSLQEFELHIKSALEGITQLLEDDEDMIGLLLSERYEASQNNKILEINRHESVELLLEEYARQLSNILQETLYLLKMVQSKQELVAISLDAYRNRIIRMNLYLSIAGISIASVTAIAGFYGMNLLHGYESDPAMFGNIVSGSTMGGLLFGVGCFAYIRGSGANNGRYKQRLHEIEIIDGALSRMGAVDYTLKCLATQQRLQTQTQTQTTTTTTTNDYNTNESQQQTKNGMTKEEFKEKLNESQLYNTISDDDNDIINDLEVDLLFSSLDVTNDGFLDATDFSTLADLGRVSNALPPKKP